MSNTEKSQSAWGWVHEETQENEMDNTEKEIIALKAEIQRIENRMHEQWLMVQNEMKVKFFEIKDSKSHCERKEHIWERWGQREAEFNEATRQLQVKIDNLSWVKE